MTQPRSQVGNGAEVAVDVLRHILSPQEPSSTLALCTMVLLAHCNGRLKLAVCVSKRVDAGLAAF